MVMKSVVLVFSLALLNLTAFAQPTRWGKVYLSNQLSMEGIVDIDFGTDRIVVERDSVMLSFHSSMIDKIITVDECDNKRLYQSFEYRSEKFGDRKSKKLFQVVATGKIGLLRRVTEFDVFYADDAYTIDEWYGLVDGKVKQIKSFRKDVLPLMDDFEAEVQDFKKKNKIKSYNDGANMYLLVSYYNRISEMYSYNGR
jgi:hypothetical protein